MGRKRRHTRRVPHANPRGVLTVVSGNHGVVRTAEGEFFIPSSLMAGAFDGDLVEIAPVKRAAGASRQASSGARSAERLSARIVRVVDRAHDSVVGRYEVAEPFGVVVPEDKRIPYDIFTMLSDNPTIPDGALVRVRISTFPSRHEAATGVIEEVLGLSDGESVSVEAVIARHKLETAFSEGALAEAAGAKLDVAGALAEGYRDLRDRVVFTVDPADARDFDDALSLESADGGASVVPGAVWRLGVHIADVSHYVEWGSSLDLDARRRATSVYLVDRVIPMLPEELSCGLCSLNPGEDRRSMTVDLYLDAQAEVVKADAYPALICSDMRLSYGQVQHMLDAGASAASGFADIPAPIAERLRALSGIAAKRVARREAAGGLSFDSPEAKVRLDEEGRPVRIDVRRKTEATSLVEEAMIMANEAVAHLLLSRNFPGVFRVHERPSPDAMAGLVPVLEEFPWFSGMSPERIAVGDAHALQAVLAAAAGRPEAELVSSLVLRSMKRAVYKPTCDGHYGLALAEYAHFTSPIRRYPDLIVHRMLRAELSGRPELFDQQVAALPWLAEHSSEMERVADDASRESQEVKIIEFMARFIGKSFSAVVSGVASWGVYVRLENTAEGIVPVRSLGAEYFALDAVRHILAGEESGRRFRLGQRVAVTLVAADPRERRLEFKLAQEG